MKYLIYAYITLFFSLLGLHSFAEQFDFITQKQTQKANSLEMCSSNDEIEPPPMSTN